MVDVPDNTALFSPPNSGNYQLVVNFNSYTIIPDVLFGYAITPLIFGINLFDLIQTEVIGTRGKFYQYTHTSNTNFVTRCTIGLQP